MEQVYSNYSTEDHYVWSLLYKEQMEQLPKLATVAFLSGIRKCKFEETKIPRYEEVNAELDKVTGWQIYVVPGLISNKPFFEHLSRKEFPATTWIRSLDKLKYIVEPDMFHDIFGHIPLLSEPFFCEFLQGLSKITLKHIDNPTIVEVVARLYWYTVEFGLIKEDEVVKIYGAGILSSPGESVFCVSNEATHLPYDVRTVFETPYNKDSYQHQYFVIESYKQLSDSLAEIEAIVEEFVQNEVYIEPSYPTSEY